MEQAIASDGIVLLDDVSVVEVVVVEVSIVDVGVVDVLVNVDVLDDIGELEIASVISGVVIVVDDCSVAADVVVVVCGTVVDVDVELTVVITVVELLPKNALLIVLNNGNFP